MPSPSRVNAKALTVLGLVNGSFTRTRANSDISMHETARAGPLV